MDMGRDGCECGGPPQATPGPSRVGPDDQDVSDSEDLTEDLTAADPDPDSASVSNSGLGLARLVALRLALDAAETASSGSSEIFRVAGPGTGPEPETESEADNRSVADSGAEASRAENKGLDSPPPANDVIPASSAPSRTSAAFRVICPNPDCRARIRLKRLGLHSCPGCRCRFLAADLKENDKDKGSQTEGFVMAARLPDDDGKLRVHCAHCDHRGRLKPVAGRYLLLCKRCGQGTTVRIQDNQSVLTDPRHLCPACASPVRLSIDSRGEMCAFCDHPQCGRDLVVSASSSLRKPTQVRLPASTRVAGQWAVIGKAPESAPAPPASDLAPPPRSLGDFELLKPIGSGGMGEIHQARRRETDQIVAVKIIRRSKLFSAHREEFERRFLREIQLVRRLSQRPHPNIASYVADGKEADEIWYAMEFAEGTPLSRILKDRLFSWEEAAWICGKIADALSHAHANGVLHRDIKDANIIVSERNEIRLVDFGLAKLMDHDVAGLTKPADLPGTIGYLAPELWQGSPHTKASDLYALGVVFLQMAFDPKIARRRDGVKFPPDAVKRGWPPPLIRLISSLIAENPEQRPASASVVRMEFHSILTRYLSPTQAEFEAKLFAP